MRCREDILRNAAASFEVFPLAFGLGSTEAEDGVRMRPSDVCERLVGERCPPTSLAVRLRLAAAHGQDAVQEEDALLGPGGQITTQCRWDPDVLLECGIDVAQTLRKLHASTDREREAHRSPVGVGILAYDDDFDLVAWCQLEGFEDVTRFWIEAFLEQKPVEIPYDVVGIALAELRVEREPAAAEIPVSR
jgi:hypothetical protein